MKRFNIFLSMATMGMVVGVVAGERTVLIKHQGATDPIQEGWIRTIGPFSSAGPITDDRGYSAWQTLGLGYPASYVWQVPGRSLSGVNWVLSATMRIATKSNIGLIIGMGYERFLLSFGQQADGDPTVLLGASMTPIFAYEGGGDGYHEYRLEYDAAARWASLRVDGLVRVSKIQGEPTGALGDPMVAVYWGSFEQGELGVAYWNRVALEIVPEPSTWALFVLGGALLLPNRRRCRPPGS